jgi:hypothetical protein
MGNRYDKDVAAWAFEQAEHLRSHHWSALDVENIAEEIESVGRSEKRELGSRMSVLIAHLLKWQIQPDHRTRSWLRTIRHQRQRLDRLLQKMPSLKSCLDDGEWLGDAFEEAVELASKETGMDDFPEQLQWTANQVLDTSFLPD